MIADVFVARARQVPVDPPEKKSRESTVLFLLTIFIGEWGSKTGLSDALGFIPRIGLPAGVFFFDWTRAVASLTSIFLP